jgi:hypothetical protein
MLLLLLPCADFLSSIRSLFSPKTGGTSLESFLVNGRHGLLLKCGVVLRPQTFIQDTLSSRYCKTATGKRAETPIHCLNMYNPLFVDWHQNHTEAKFFCFIREPVARFLSNYNMRMGTRSGSCDKAKIAKYLNESYLPGEYDNHDRPQVSFACDMPMCYDRMQEDFSQLLKSKKCNISDMRLTHERDHIKQLGHSCTANDLTAENLRLIKERYVEDEALYHKVCGKDSYEKIR